MPVGSAAKYEAAFAAMVRERAEAVLFLTNTALHRRYQAACRPRAGAQSWLSMFGTKPFVLAGGLISYAPNRNDLWRRGAIVLDKGAQRHQSG